MIQENIKFKQNTRRSFQISGHTWHVELTDDHQFIVLAEVPYEDIDPLWYDWDDPYPMVTTRTEELTFQVSPVIVIRKIVQVIITLVFTRKPDSFYFQANTDKKIKIYRILSERYLKHLPGKWEVQEIGNWFFFHEISGLWQG